MMFLESSSSQCTQKESGHVLCARDLTHTISVNPHDKCTINGFYSYSRDVVGDALRSGLPQIQWLVMDGSQSHRQVAQLQSQCSPQLLCPADQLPQAGGQASHITHAVSIQARESKDRKGNPRELATGRGFEKELLNKRRPVATSALLSHALSMTSQQCRTPGESPALDTVSTLSRFPRNDQHAVG